MQRTNKLNIYSIVKKISYELLTEEILQSQTEISDRFLKKSTKKFSSIKLKFFSYKIINCIILAIQPIFLLITYLNLNQIIDENLHFQTILFIKAINFQFFFVLQLFNFLLMGLFNLTTIMSGDTYDWIKTLPLSRKDLKKLVFYTIYHNMNLPIIANIVAFPVIMLIGTQNIFVFFTSIGVSILNTIFSLTLLIILGEKITRFMKKHNSRSRKPLFIQLINSFSYVIIIFGGIFIIEIVLNSVLFFLLNLSELTLTPFYNISLYLIPFPFNMSYLVLISTNVPQMHLIFWVNLFYGLGLYLITLYFLTQKSFKSLGAVLSLKYKAKEIDNGLSFHKETFRIRIKSHFKAFIRKDLSIASRDLQTSMFFIMPIIMSITFIFFFNFSLTTGSEGSFNNFFIYNWLVMLGFSPVISLLIVHNILNIDNSGKTIINTLPILRRSQAKAKIFLIFLIQILAVITPTLILVLFDNVFEIFIAFLSSLPYIIVLSMGTFLLRIYLFGRKKYNYTLEEARSINKVSKWAFILAINFMSYLFFVFVSYYFYFSFNISLFILNQLCISLIISFFLKDIFDRFFPKKKKHKWNLRIGIILVYCYIVIYLIISRDVILFPVAFLIPILLLSLTGLIIYIKFGIIAKRKPNKKIKEPKLKKVNKEVEEKSNWANILLLLSILFFAYSLLPIFIAIASLIYSLIGFFLIIIGLSLIFKLLKTPKEKSKRKPIETKDYFQIDFLKAIMIFLVIFDHTIPWSIKDSLGVALWERISIPVFLVIMGFNFGTSYENRGKSLGSNYLYRKLSRYLIPYIILYIISTAVGIYFYGYNVELMLLRQHSSFEFDHLFIGILPFWGPGNWFIPVLFGSIVILPIIYKGFSGKTIWAVITLILCFLTEIGLQYLVYSQLKPFTLANRSTVFMFLCSILFYSSAIGIGFWFSRNNKIFSWHNLLIWILFPLSLTYLIAYQFFNYRFTDGDGIAYLTGDYNFLVIPYSALLVLLTLKILPKIKNSVFTRYIAIIGKSTYHILLTQILYFAILIAIYGDHYGVSILGEANDDLAYFINLFINWAICIPIGILWWSTENSIRNFFQKRKRIALEKNVLM